VARGRSERRFVVHRADPERDRPRWPVLGGVAVIALLAGILWPRACGVRFGAESPEEAASIATSAEPTQQPEPSVVAPPDAGPAPIPASSNEAPALAAVLVGKSTLMRCQDPPTAELKPSKCGEHGLDPVLVPKLEAVSSCPAVAGVAGKLALSVDVNFKTQALKVVAGKGSSTNKNGRRDDKAIEPLLQCIRASVKELLSSESAPKPEHARYVLAYPVTITATSAAAPAASGSVEKEKAASGVATVQVDTAIVRDAPSTSGQPIGRLSRGTKVTTIGTSGNWFHVKFGDNDAQEGWIFRTNIGR
jgi:hypothetical protein